MKARLHTKYGGFVAEVQMPFFMTPPDAVLWGQRFFILDDRPLVNNEAAYTYNEAFVWYATLEEPRDMSREKGTT